MFGSSQKPDPVAELIEALKGEVSYLRAQLVEKDKQIIALTNASAYRLLHSPSEPVVAAITNPTDEKEPFRPKATLADIRDSFTDS